MAELYMKISNESVTLDSERKLNDKELYLYAFLQSKKGWNGEVLMAYDILIGEIVLFDDKNEGRLKKKIRETVNSLEAKGYLNVQHSDKYFKATFEEVADNFTSITFGEVERIKDPLDFYIFTCVKRWNRAKYSFSIWAELIGKSESRTKSIIKSAVDRGIIYRLIGSYSEEEVNGYRRQDSNTYCTTPFKVEEIEQQPKKKEMTVEDVLETEEGKSKFPDYKLGQWFTKNLLGFYDFLEYYKRKEDADAGDELAKEFVEHCEKEIEKQLKKKGVIPATTKTNLENAKEKLNQEKEAAKKKEVENRIADKRIDRHLAELNGEIDYDNIIKDDDEDIAI